MPAPTATLIEPSFSSALSSTVPTVTAALPLVGTVTVRAPVAAPKSPSWPTVKSTVSGADGAGTAETVKTASPPSVTPPPAETLISGTTGGAAFSSTVAVADEEVPTT